MIVVEAIGATLSGRAYWWHGVGGWNEGEGAQVIIVVMGVAGCGKSTVGRRLAAVIGVPFFEGDRFHPPANIAKMRGGLALDDADRLPWLDRIAARLAASGDCGAVVSCSALKWCYRDRLRQKVPSLRLLYLSVSREQSRRRLQHRAGHFMPVALLDSQFAALEPPRVEESAIVVDAEQPIDAVLAHAVESLQRMIGGVS